MPDKVLADVAEHANIPTLHNTAIGSRRPVVVVCFFLQPTAAFVCAGPLDTLDVVATDADTMVHGIHEADEGAGEGALLVPNNLLDVVRAVSLLCWPEVLQPLFNWKILFPVRLHRRTKTLNGTILSPVRCTCVFYSLCLFHCSCLPGLGTPAPSSADLQRPVFYKSEPEGAC